MWIVRTALDRTYTFVVLALLILILSPLVILRTPTDIFPNINIPVIAVVSGQSRNCGSIAATVLVAAATWIVMSTP
jgi:hypothetical protein